MTTDEQYAFYLERPTPTTPMQSEEIGTYARGHWVGAESSPDLSRVSRSQVRWRPEPKTVPAWPPVMPYWVKFAGTGQIVQATGFDDGQVLLGTTWFSLRSMKHDLWTDDLRTDPVVWHTFTKEAEE